MTVDELKKTLSDNDVKLSLERAGGRDAVNNSGGYCLWASTGSGCWWENCGIESGFHTNYSKRHVSGFQ